MDFWGKARATFGTKATAVDQASPRDVFAAEVEAAARAVPSVTSVQRTAHGFGVRINRGGKQYTLFLDNVFAETRDIDPRGRRERIARLLRTMDAPDPAEMDWADVRRKLAPLLRTPSLFGSFAGTQGRDTWPINRPFAPFLVECVGVDSEDGIRYVTPSLLSTLGVDRSDVFAGALENARRHFVDDIQSYDSDAPYPIWYVARDDSYESSRILLPGWLASFSGKVSGRPVAIVPHRGLLVVGGDGDERCLRRMIDAAKAEFEASPRRISAALYTVENAGRVVPFVVPDEHPLASEIALGHRLTAMAEYEFQKQQLDQQLPGGVFIASYVTLRDKAGPVFSVATWAKGVPTLLPQTDQVALNLAPPQAKDAAIVFVGWQALLDFAGDCLAPVPDLNPPRWKTAGWPSDDCIERLKKIAVH